MIGVGAAALRLPLLAGALLAGFCAPGGAAAGTPARASLKQAEGEPGALAKPSGEAAKEPVDAFADLIAATTQPTGQQIYEVTATLAQPDKTQQLAPAQRMAAQVNAVAAQGKLAEAQRYVREAAAAAQTDPAYAEHLRRMASDATVAAGQYAAAASVAVGRSPPDGGAKAGAGTGIMMRDACRETCHLLQTIAGGSEGGELWRFDGARPPGTRSPTPPPAEDHTFGRGLERGPLLIREGDRQKLLLPNGDELDLAALDAATRAVDPAAARAPLFTDCTGNGRACPSPALLAMLNDPERRKALANIGGVALDATFDVLGLAGMSDFRGGTDLSLIDRPVLLSLRGLADAAAPYASPQSWDNAPDAVRFPGNIARVIGFVLDPLHGDIDLIGIPAKSPESRIDADEIVLAVRQVWRDGKTMAVSLDPRPDDFGGPQYARVINLPEDSIAAKIMLDADYAMKAITMEAGWAAPLGILDLPDLIDRFDDNVDAMARLWLTPRYLDSGSIYASASGRTMLIAGGVDVRTEEIVLAGGQLIGAGQVGEYHRLVAEAMAKALPSLEDDPRVPPRRIYLRLHGLMDLVTMAKIWRTRQIALPVLDRIAGLPVRQLTGDEAAPHSYPGLSAVVRGTVRTIQFSGGVDLPMRASGSAERRYADHVALELEQAVDGAAPASGFARAVAVPIALPEAAVLPDREAEAIELEASHALESGNAADADAGFARLIALRPAEAAGYAGRALVALARDDPHGAIPFALQAMLLAPDDEAAQMLGRDIAWRLNPARAYAGLPETERERLSESYLRRARLARRRHADGEADRLLGWAIDLWEDNGEAHLTRAFALPEGTPARELELARAIRGYRSQVRKGMSEARPPLALALTISAGQHYQQAARHFELLKPGAALAPAESELVVRLLDRAGEEASAAVVADDRLAPAAATKLMIDATASVLSQQGEADRLRTLRAEGEALKQRFPDEPSVLVADALVAEIAGAVAEAGADYDRAIALAPASVELRHARAEWFSRQGNCPAAAADLAIASRTLAESGNAALAAPAACVGG